MLSSSLNKNAVLESNTATANFDFAEQRRKILRATLQSLLLLII